MLMHCKFAKINCVYKKLVSMDYCVIKLFALVSRDFKKKIVLILD